MIARAAVERSVRACALAVFAAALLAYGAAVAGTYVFDDIHSVASNPALQDLGDLGRVWVDPSAFSPGTGRMYRPVLLSSFLLSFAVSTEAWALKAGNVLLHAGVAVALFAWLWRLSRNLRASTVVAVLFAVHPLASEAVNLVSARSEVLVLLGVLLALHAHLSLLRGGGRWSRLGMVGATVLACGSKETGVVVPLLCAVQAWSARCAPRERTVVSAAAGLLPMVVVVAGYLVLRKLLLGEVAVPLLGRAGEDPSAGYGRTLTMQLATMGTLLPGCVLQMLWPSHLTVDPVVVLRPSFAQPAVLLGWGTMAALSIAAWWPGPSARQRRLGLVLAWAIALPWIVVPLNMPLAEHRLYAPMAGVAAIVVAVAPRLARGFARAWAHRPQLLLHAPSVGFAAAVLAGIVLSARQSLLYRDERALWSDALAQNPTSFRSWWGLGTARLRGGDVAGSLEPLAKAHALCPPHFDTLRNYTEALVSVPDDHADPERTLDVAARLLAVSPNDPWARTLLAQAHLQAGRVRGAPAAREHFATAERLALSCLTIAEPKGYVYQLAAAARRGAGDLPGALAHLDTSIAHGLATVPVRLDRAATLRDLGRPRDAQHELLRAQRDAPHDPRVLHALMQAAPPR